MTAIKPVLRRQAQAVWDLAAAWQAEEPTTHHTALPSTLLLAILTICRLWGWTKEAGMFALSWGGLLRFGEAAKLRRSDVIYPADVLDAQTFILIRLQEPKTRFKAARHQAAKLEPGDLVRLPRLLRSPQAEPHLAVQLADLEETTGDSLEKTAHCGWHQPRAKRQLGVLSPWRCHLPSAVDRGLRAGPAPRALGEQRSDGDIPARGRGIHLYP